MSTVNFTAMDARLEVGLEQQAELMLKMMATLHADSILQALTSSSSTGNPHGQQQLLLTTDGLPAIAGVQISLVLISVCDFQSTSPQMGPMTAC